MSERTVKQLRDEANRLRAKHNHNAANALDERASEIGDLPERLFAHSLELIGDDEDADPSVLFCEIQDAAHLLAKIRNSDLCEVCDTPAQCASRKSPCYLSGEFIAEQSA